MKYTGQKFGQVILDLMHQKEHPGFRYSLYELKLDENKVSPIWERLTTKQLNFSYIMDYVEYVVIRVDDEEGGVKILISAPQE